MAHILIIPDQVRSKLITTVALAERLQALGHQITFAAPAATGPQLGAVAQVPLELSLKRPESETSAGSARQRRAAILDRLAIEQLDQVLQTQQPDLLLIDIEAHVAVIAAAGRRLPVAVFSVFFNLWPDRDLPPLNSLAVPQQGLAGSRLGMRLSWWRLQAALWLAEKQRHWRRRGTDQYSLLKDWGERCGFPLSANVERRAWLSPFVYRTLPTLVLNATALEFPHQPPANHYYVGPAVYTNRGSTELGAVAAVDAEVITAALQRAHDNPGRKLIYCAFGAYYTGDDRAFWHKLADAVAEQPWEVIFALGSRLAVESLGTLPANVTCVSWAPQTDILARADAAVIHGGMTTVYECLHFRVPMLLYPYEVNDQPGTAARVAHHGIGLLGHRQQDSSERIRARIKALLSDQAIAQRIESMQQSIEDDRSRDYLANTISTLLARPADIG